MPLTYNFGGNVVPNVNSRIYKYTNLPPVFEIKLTDESNKSRTIVINSRKMIGEAWKYIEDNCAKSKDCNNYFTKLGKKGTLADILRTVKFTVHLLTPREGHKEQELPFANSAGSDFGLSINAFLDPTQALAAPVQALAATILHEIAHFAGATTNTRDADALDAEKSLLPCGLGKYYHPEAKG